MKKLITKKLFNHNKVGNRAHKFRFRTFFSKPYVINLGLCDDCKKLGYCALWKRGTLQKAITNAQPIQATYLTQPTDYKVRFTIREYLDLIPIKIEGSRFGNYSKLHLQIACDAFHQEDYETAILHFRAVLEVSNLYEANIGLAVAYFIVNDFESAIRFAEYSSDREVSIIKSLKEDIVKFSRVETAFKEQVITEATSVETDRNLQLSALQNASMVDARLVSVVG